jgi:hypothetical protein
MSQQAVLRLGQHRNLGVCDVPLGDLSDLGMPVMLCARYALWEGDAIGGRNRAASRPVKRADLRMGCSHNSSVLVIRISFDRSLLIGRGMIF